MEPGAAEAVLMYFVLPLWVAAGFADYLCHRATSLETTSGWKESILHLLQLGEMAIPTLAALFLEINALIIAIMIICLVAHQATAMWDVSYAYRVREIRPIEQHVHSFLEMLPLMGLLIVVTLHWGQFLALFGLGPELADFGLRLKRPPLPWIYVTVILALVLLFEILPYVEELVRSIRRDKQSRRIDGSEQGQSRSSRRPL